MYNLFLKIGDQSIIRDQNLGIKNGQIVDIIPAHVEISSNMQKVFAHFSLSDSVASVLLPYLQPEFQIIDNERYLVRKRQFHFDLPQLAQILGDPSLVEKWAGPDSIGAIPISNLGQVETLIKNSKLIDYNKKIVVPDLNVFTSGTKTYGSAGDYASFLALEADLGTMTGPVTATIVSNVTESAQVSLNNDMAGFKMTQNSNVPHGGDILSGWTHTSFSGFDLIWRNVTNAGAWEVAGYTMEATGDGGGNSCIEDLDDFSEIHNMFFLNQSTGSGGVLRFFSSSSCKIYNNVVHKSGVNATGISPRSGGDGTVIENNVVDGGNTGISSGTNANIIQNNACFNNTTGFAAISNCTGKNNISHDATNADVNWSTGSGNVESATVADEVISESIASFDYMRPKSGGNMWDGGLIPTNPTTDMAGETYATPYPIGAYMPEGAQEIIPNSIASTLVIHSVTVETASVGAIIPPTLIGGFQTL